MDVKLVRGSEYLIDEGVAFGTTCLMLGPKTELFDLFCEKLRASMPQDGVTVTHIKTPWCTPAPKKQRKIDLLMIDADQFQLMKDFAQSVDHARKTGDNGYAVMFFDSLEPVSEERRDDLWDLGANLAKANQTDHVAVFAVGHTGDDLYPVECSVDAVVKVNLSSLEGGLVKLELDITKNRHGPSERREKIISLTVGKTSETTP